jgi:hypothetical protein
MTGARFGSSRQLADLAVSSEASFGVVAALGRASGRPVRSMSYGLAH